MKIRAILSAVIILTLYGRAFPQKLITLQECYNQAVKKNPISSEKETYNAIWKLRDKNLSRSWLPTIDANGSYIYNSDIVDFTEVFSTLPIPGIGNAIPLMPHDAYKVTLDVNQMIYDGGSVRKAKNVEEADLKINQQLVESDLYKIRSQINNLFFSILLIERQEELLDNYIEVIDKRLSSMRSGADNGVLMKSDLDVMTSERIKIEQQLTEIVLKRSSLVAVLSDLTGLELDKESGLVLPQINADLEKEITRPELMIFDLRIDQLEAGKDLLQARRMPKAYGFATLAYGAPPGNNFFESGVSPFYIVGAGIKWNIYDWGKVKDEKQQVVLQQGVLQGRKEDMEDNLKRSLETKEAEIKGLQASLQRDSVLISLRKKITASAESQYQNGTITASELLNEMNSEKQAEINYEIHKISLVMAKTEYINICGKEIE